MVSCLRIISGLTSMVTLLPSPTKHTLPQARVLRTADPENSTLFLIATLYAWSGRFADAEALFDDLEKRAAYLCKFVPSDVRGETLYAVADSIREELRRAKQYAVEHPTDPFPLPPWGQSLGSVLSAIQ